MVEQRVEEPGEGLQLVGIEVLDLVDAEDERLLADEGQLGEGQQDLLDLVVIAQHDRFLAVDLQAE